MLKDFLIELNKLCESLDKTYNINNGGCCFVAYIIAKNLDKFKIKYFFSISDYDEKIKEEVNKEITTMTKNNTNTSSVTGDYTCKHYFIKVNGRYINPLKDTCKKYFFANISPKKIKWIYDNGNWNDCYKKRNNCIIRKAINNFFKENYKLITV